MQSPVNGAGCQCIRYRNCGTQQRYARTLANPLSRDTKLSERVGDQLRDEATGPRKVSDVASKRLSPRARLDELGEPSQHDDQSQTPTDRLELFPHHPWPGSKHQVAQ